MMGKYERLLAFLEEQTVPHLKLSFAQFERILADTLPESARHHQAWWADERVGTHQHSRSWVDAGYETRRLRLSGATVEFVRSPSPKSRSRM
jgi:hypothetical protein